METLWEQGWVLTEEEKIQEIRVRGQEKVKEGVTEKKEEGLQKCCF